MKKWLIILATTMTMAYQQLRPQQAFLLSYFQRKWHLCIRIFVVARTVYIQQLFKLELVLTGFLQVRQVVAEACLALI